jgi:hypothetical protein
MAESQDEASSGALAEEHAAASSSGDAPPQQQQTMTAKMTSADQQHYELLQRAVNHFTVENDFFGSRNKTLEEEMQKLVFVLANVNIKQTILEKIFTQFSSLDTKLFEEHVKKVMAESQDEASSGALAEEHAAALLGPCELLQQIMKDEDRMADVFKKKKAAWVDLDKTVTAVLENQKEAKELATTHASVIVE